MGSITAASSMNVMMGTSDLHLQLPLVIPMGPKWISKTLFGWHAIDFGAWICNSNWSQMICFLSCNMVPLQDLCVILRIHSQLPWRLEMEPMFLWQFQSGWGTKGPRGVQNQWWNQSFVFGLALITETLFYCKIVFRNRQWWRISALI